MGINIIIYIFFICILAFQTENGKQKPRTFSLIHLPFAHPANESLSLVPLLIKKKTVW